MADGGDMRGVTALGGGQVIHGGFSEIERAADYRERVGKLLTEVCGVMADAKRDGMTVTFQIGTADGFGRFSVAMLEVSKKLAG